MQYKHVFIKYYIGYWSIEQNIKYKKLFKCIDKDIIIIKNISDQKLVHIHKKNKNYD